MLAGNYATPAIYVEVKGVFTNTAPVDAYRGAGRPEACYVVERLVDRAAREMRLDPVALRRRNFIPNDAYPYTTPVALTYDSGDYFKTLDMAVKAADYASFEQRRKGAAKRGKLRGIGISTYIEACAMAPSVIAGQLGARAGFYETAEVRAHPTGSITVFTGSHSHGQGHETTFAQLVADRFGVPLEMVDIVHGDTGHSFGMGTYASRSLAVGGTALVKAMDKIVAKAKKIAAHLLEAAEADVEFADGKFTVTGTDRAVPFRSGGLRRLCPAQLSDRHAGARLKRDRFLRSHQLHLSCRRLYRRGSKSIAKPARSSSSTSPALTTSAASIACSTMFLQVN